MMNGIRIIALCISAALICAALRSTHPQLASAAALAACVAALMLSVSDLTALTGALKSLEAQAEKGTDLSLLKTCAIALIAEFASDICRDAGEGALSRRIDTGIRIGIAAAALPTLAEVMQRISGLLS